jgi:DNA-binding XRE family transcriptional regulator
MLHFAAPHPVTTAQMGRVIEWAGETLWRNTMLAAVLDGQFIAGLDAEGEIVFRLAAPSETSTMTTIAAAQESEHLSAYTPVPVPEETAFPPRWPMPREHQAKLSQRREVARHATAARHGSVQRVHLGIVTDREADATTPSSGPALRTWREQIGLTQQAAAHLAGISQALLAQIEGESACNKWYGSRQRITAALAKYVATAERAR